MSTEMLALDQVPATRQAVYRFLRAAFSMPTPEQHAWMRGSQFARSLGELAQAFGVAVPAEEAVPLDWIDHESRYLACFEVGMPSPPVPLLASHYQKREPVPRILHEHLLFYRRFAMPGPDRDQAPADHLVYQLDFLIHLDELLLKDRVEAQSALWARQDFLSRHVLRWITDACKLAEENRLPAVYRALLAILLAAIAEDLQWTTVNRQEKTEEVSR